MTDLPEAASLAAALGDRYSIERQLGRGGMGAVYLARDLRLDRQVAIKLLPVEMATDALLRERFLRETRIAASFSHPNIVPVHAIEERPGLLAFVMGYVEGESLSQRVARAGPLTAREILRLLLDIGYALAYAHSRDVIHRDVKPDNVMIERATGRALLMDFGISRSVSSDKMLAGVTRIGEVVGTPEYMSPEQSVGDVVDGRSDLYSLALTAYYAATGHPAFSGDSTQKILMRQLSEAPPPLATLRPDLPRVLADAVDCCLLKDPAERFENAAALVNALEAAQSFAPDIPMPIRLFTQEVAQLGLVMFFVVLIVWMFIVTSGRSLSDDVFIPVILLAAIFVSRILQILAEARRMVRHGFPARDIQAGLMAVLDEKEARRIQLRSDDATQRVRKRTVIIASAMLLGAALLVRSALGFRHRNPSGHGFYVELPGAVMFISALLMFGLGLPLLLRSPLRMPMTERIFRWIWSGPLGRGFLLLAARGVATAGQTRVTAPAVVASRSRETSRVHVTSPRVATSAQTASQGTHVTSPRVATSTQTAAPDRLDSIEARLAAVEIAIGQINVVRES